MLTSYSSSVSQGTAANRLTQAKTYLTFALHYHFNPLQPTSTNTCMYIQYLKNSFQVPTTVKNYLSRVKTWVAQHGGDLGAFSSFEYSQLASGISKRSQHIPQRAEPLSWDHIQFIINFLESSCEIPLSVKPCILIGFHTFLRSSNLLSPSLSTWGGPITLSVQDLTLPDQGLEVTVRSLKTEMDPTPVKNVIPWSSDSKFCAAKAWLKYVTNSRPWALRPAFLTYDRLPLTARHVVGLMRLALKDAKDLIPSKISMHSLRRGATQSAARLGLSHDQIKERGMWRSDSGMSLYLA